MVKALAWDTRREENAPIKQGKRPDSFDARPSRGRQKDTEARWTKKHGRYCYGYKNHAKADLSRKRVIDYQAIPASVHDSQVLPDLVNPGDDAVLADAAYSGNPAAGVLTAREIRSFIHQKAAPGQPLSEAGKTLNRKKSRLSARVEHVFGWQSH